MRKILILVATLCLLISLSFNLYAEADKNYKWVTAYYCDPPYDPQNYCLTYKGIGNIWLIVLGKIKTIQIKVPANGIEIVPPTPPGYTEHDKFFLFTNNPDFSTGIGLLDGCLHFKDSISQFYYYELEEQNIINNYLEWDQLKDN